MKNMMCLVVVMASACVDTASSTYTPAQDDSGDHDVLTLIPSDSDDHPLNPGTMPCANNDDCAPKGGGPSGAWECTPDGNSAVLYARIGVCLSIGWCETEQYAVPCPWGCELQVWGAEECNSPTWSIEPPPGAVALTCTPCEPPDDGIVYHGVRWCKDKITGVCVSYPGNDCKPHDHCTDYVDCTFDRCGFDGKCEHLPVDSWCGYAEFACVNRSEDAGDGGCVKVCNPSTNDVVTGQNETCKIFGGGGSPPCVPGIPDAYFYWLFTERCTIRGFCESPMPDVAFCDEGMTCVDGAGCQPNNE